MTVRTFNLQVYAPATDQESSWAQRSTGPGVVWAHNFESSSEVTQFLYPASITTYTSQNTDPLAAYRDTAPEFGTGAGCLVSRTRSARILDDLPSVPENTANQLIRVSDASQFPDPATYYNAGGYRLILGGAQDTPGVIKPQEMVQVRAINYTTNTLTVTRGVQLGTYWGGLNTAPAHAAQTPIGTADQMRWQRIMMPFAAGQNGKSTPDIGIANGYRTKTWTWSHAIWGRFRGSFWGHSAVHTKYDAKFPPDDTYVGGYGATYGFAQPTAAIPQITNSFAHADPEMCNEFWIQWRMWYPSLKLQDNDGKLFYLHPVHSSLPQQLFMGTNPSSHIPGAAGGTGPKVLIAHRNGPAIQDNGGTVMDVDIPYNHWIDGWATWMLHVKPGRSDAENPSYAGTPQGSHNNAVPEGLIELYVAGPTESSFTLIQRTSNFRFEYGIPFSIHRTTPAIYSAFNPSNYPNAYISDTSSQGAPLTNHAVKYAQVILSRYEIPCPQPLV